MGVDESILDLTARTRQMARVHVVSPRLRPLVKELHTILAQESLGDRHPRQQHRLVCHLVKETLRKTLGETLDPKSILAVVVFSSVGAIHQYLTHRQRCEVW